jgi:hypothetical protein
MQDFSLPCEAMQKLLSRFFFPMRVVPARPGIWTSSESQVKWAEVITSAAWGWHPRQARVTAWGLSKLAGVTGVWSKCPRTLLVAVAWARPGPALGSVARASATPPPTTTVSAAARTRDSSW